MSFKISLTSIVKHWLITLFFFWWSFSYNFWRLCWPMLQIYRWMEDLSPMKYRHIILAHWTILFIDGPMEVGVLCKLWEVLYYTCFRLYKVISKVTKMILKSLEYYCKKIYRRYVIWYLVCIHVTPYLARICMVSKAVYGK